MKVWLVVIALLMLLRSLTGLPKSGGDPRPECRRPAPQSVAAQACDLPR